VQGPDSRDAVGVSKRYSFVSLVLWLGCASSRVPPPNGVTVDPVPSHSVANERAASPAVEPATVENSSAPVVGDVDVHELNRHYREVRDVAAWRARFESDRREVAKRRPEVLAELDLAPGMVVADVGAGTGLYTFPMARSVGRTGKVFAVDVEDYFLEDLRAHAKASDLVQVEVVHATHSSVELPTASTDLAFLCEVYHHIEQPIPYLQSLFAAIRPGGRLVIVDYARVEGAKEFIFSHVRASPEVFRAEIEAAGFRFDRAPDVLEENFVFVFTRP